MEVDATGPPNGAAQVDVLPGGDGLRYETQSPATSLRERLAGAATGRTRHRRSRLVEPRSAVARRDPREGRHTPRDAAQPVKPALTVRSVTTGARRSGKRILVTISARLSGRTAGAAEAFAAAITSGKRTVGRGSRLLSGTKARTSARVTLSGPVTASGTLQVRSSVTALSGSPVPLTSAKRARVAVR